MATCSVFAGISKFYEVSDMEIIEHAEKILDKISHPSTDPITTIAQSIARAETCLDKIFRQTSHIQYTIRNY